MATRHVSYVQRPAYVLPIKDKTDIGKVIGKGGSKIRELEEQSGARINVNSAQSTVSIFGNEQSAIDAKFLVQRIIGGPNNRILKDLDGKSIQAISQAADWLETLQAKLDIYIEISARDIIIEADDEVIQNLDEAERQIQEKLEAMLELKTVIESLSNPTQLSQVFQDPMLVSLREAHGLEIETVKTDAGTGVSLSGSAAVVEEARLAVHAIVAGGSRSNIVMLIPGMLAECDEDKWYDLNSDLTAHISQNYDVLVNFQRISDRIVLSTTREDDDEILKLATRMCQEILMYYFADRCCLFYCIPHQALASVLGRDDAELVRMSNRQCILTADREKSQVWICGSAKFVGSAATRLEGNLDRWRATNLIVNLPDERCKGFIVGTGGSNLRRIQAESGCTITCEGAIVHITGNSLDEMEAAKRLVNEAVHQWQDRRANNTYEGGYSSSQRGRGSYTGGGGRGSYGGGRQQFGGPQIGAQQMSFPLTPGRGRSGKFY